MFSISEAFGELSIVTQQIVRNPFDCTNGCDLTAIYAIIIGAIISTIVLSIQIQLAREQHSIRKLINKTKLRSDAITLLNQMRMIQPIVYEKSQITQENKMQVSGIAKSINELEKDLKKLNGEIAEEDKEKIIYTITKIKKRLKYGSTDFGKWPHRFDAMDFSDSIKDLGVTLSLFP